jgi:short-subunit dehydrogenase
MKTVLITGANGGLGKALVEIFFNNNFKVIALDKRFHNLSIFKKNINLINCDLSNTQNVSKIIKKINKFKIDILINNAAICESISLNKITTSNIMKTLNTNCISHIMLTLKLLHNLKKNKGIILNISSIHAKTSKKKFLPYAVSKAALSSFSRNLSLESNGKCSVINIEPGAINTKMLNKDLTDKEIKILKKITPNKKVIDPVNLSELIFCLINSSSVQLLNGSNFDINGGILNLLPDQK